MATNHIEDKGRELLINELNVFEIIKSDNCLMQLFAERDKIDIAIRERKDILFDKYAIDIKQYESSLQFPFH